MCAPIGGSIPVDHGSQVTSDNESVCSDASWVVAPAPRFCGSSETNESKSNHPLENLLIEHPTMSVYGQISVNENMETVQSADAHLLPAVSGPSRQTASRQRHQLAVHMNVPPKVPMTATQRVQFKHPKVSRRSLTRHNANVTKTRGPRMQTRLSKAAGRRGC